MRFIALAAVAVAALITPQPASADTVTDWWEVANRYYNAAQGSPGPLPPETARASTRTALAMFEAVNAIDRRYHSHIGFPRAADSASRTAAAAKRPYRMLSPIRPTRARLRKAMRVRGRDSPKTEARALARTICDGGAKAVMQLGGVERRSRKCPIAARRRRKG